MSEILNKVASSGLISLDMEEMYPEGERVLLDIKNQLWQGLALREKDFREWLKTNDWSVYSNKFVAVTCSVDAIIPHWAYMLVASKLEGIAKRVVFGNVETLEQTLFTELISKINIEDFRDKRLVIKGCADKPVPVSAYVELVNKLQPVAKSIMFGEPCSTVPVFKR
ncbi:MAG: DUF2480 family protein [Flavobacteriales bacterium]|nr:DUF2480 family protein [Flavobacteriales bacterium]